MWVLTAARRRSRRAEPKGGAEGRSRRAEPEGGAGGRSRRAEPRGGAGGRSRGAEPEIHGDNSHRSGGGARLSRVRFAA